MPEGRGIFRSLSVWENLLLHTPPWMREETTRAGAERLPVLRERLKQTAGNLSGGQQQMLALARIHLSNPARRAAWTRCQWASPP